MGIPLAVAFEFDEGDDFNRPFKLAVAGFVVTQTLSHSEKDLVIDYVFAKHTLPQLALHRWVSMSEVTQQIDKAFSQLEDTTVFLKIVSPDNTSVEVLFADVIASDIFNAIMWQ